MIYLKPYGKTFQFKAGQYLTIKKSFNGTEVRRSYSICSTPESGKLTIGIKKLENGLFSQYANNDLREGETIEVHEPEGRFIYLPSSGSQNYPRFCRREWHYSNHEHHADDLRGG